VETDLPLKRLTMIRAADLLPLLGAADAKLVGVESLELPSVATKLDTVLRLRSSQGTGYLQLVEWQAYRDKHFLWRPLGYLAWLGREHPELPIAVTVVYVHPGDDVGNTLRCQLEGQELWSITFRAVRLWEHDAAAAVASGLPGLAVLSPLMHGASAALVEQAATLLLASDDRGQNQNDLLTILGIFAAPLVATERLVHMIGRERLMGSELIEYLMAEKLAEHDRELEAREARLEARLAEERAARERAAVEAQAQAAVAALDATVQDAVIARFPNTPFSAIGGLRQIRDVHRLQELHAAILRAPDQATVERLLQAGQ